MVFSAGPLPDCLPPRLLAERPRVELFDFDLDSPERAFSLFTVRAATSLARFVERPSFFLAFDDFFCTADRVCCLF